MEQEASDTAPSQTVSTGAMVWTGIKDIGGLAGRGALALFSCLAIMVVLGVVLGVICAWIVPANFWWRLLTAFLVWAIFAVEGWFLGLKLALATVVVAGVRQFHIASRVLGLVFDAMERLLGERAMRKVQRLPLRQAEEVLTRAITPLSAHDPAAGWFRRWVLGSVYRRLLKLVAAITLAEFRLAEAQGSGIDLDAVRDRLSGKIDHLVEERMLGGARKLIALVVAVSVVVVLGLAIGVRMWRVPAPAAAENSVPTSVHPEAGS